MSVERVGHGVYRATCKFTSGATPPSTYDGTPTYTTGEPTAVTCTVTSPSGISNTYTLGVDGNLTLEGSGDDRYYACTFSANEDGNWDATWAGTGVIEAGKTWTFPVSIRA